MLICEHDGRDLAIGFDALLVAVGRVANTAGYGLEELGIPLTQARTVQTNEFLETLYPNIYACGDVAGPFQFTHTAAHQAWYAAVNGLFGELKKFRADYSVIPWATFTDPEVARVGLNETEAKARGVAYEVSTYGMEDLDRAIADEEAHGVVKVLTVPGRDRILGVTIAGEHAGDLIAEFVAAMRHGMGLDKVLGTIHIYPTLAEANKYAAGVWKKAHAPQKLLGYVERFHAWMRGRRRGAVIGGLAAPARQASLQGRLSLLSCFLFFLSIVLPSLNEAAGIERCLAALAPLRARGHEVIVADGGSADGTAARAAPLADRVLEAPRGRAAQMNAGAAAASGDALLFLHADTFLPPDADQAVLSALGARAWGRFDVAIDSRDLRLALVAFLMNWRSRLTGIATGDQAIFVRRADFRAISRDRAHGGHRLQPRDEARLAARLPARARAHLGAALGALRRAAHRISHVAAAPAVLAGRRSRTPCRALWQRSIIAIARCRLPCSPGHPSRAQ